MVDRIERAHPGPPERQAAENGDADVSRHDQSRHHVRAGHDFFRTVGRFGLEQPHATDTQQRQNRDRHTDKPDAADPVQQRAPHQDAGGHFVQMVEHGRTGGRDAGHAFEKRVGVTDVLGQQKRQGGEDAHHQPAADGQQVHVPWPQVNVLGASGDDHGEAGDKGDHAGPEERRQIAGALEDHQCAHRYDHGDGQGYQEDADDETNET
ncbi:hypothetical protein D3C73_731440 [compost metagenome]